MVLTYIGLFIFGIFVSVRILVSYLYALELVPQSHRKRWNLIASSVEACTVLFLATYFGLIKYGESIIVIYALTSIISLFFIYRAPESPQFLYTKRRWEQLHSGFSKISKINGKEWSGFRFDREEQKINEFTIKTKCKSVLGDRKSIRNIFIMITNWSTCSFCYYLLSYNSKYFKGNIYSNTALLGLADILAVLTMRVIQIFFQTKTGFVISYLIVFVVSLIYYAVMSSVAMVAVGVLFMRYGITAAFTFSYFGNAEFFFQTDMVSTAFGICNTFARMSTILSPMVTEVMNEPIIILTLVTAVSAAVSWFLIKPKNILDSTAESYSAEQLNGENVDERLPDVVRDFGGDSVNHEMPQEEEKETVIDPNEYDNSSCKKELDFDANIQSQKVVSGVANIFIGKVLNRGRGGGNLKVIDSIILPHTQNLNNLKGMLLLKGEGLFDEKFKTI